jgi:hypothetical protein
MKVLYLDGAQDDLSVWRWIAFRIVLQEVVQGELGAGFHRFRNHIGIIARQPGFPSEKCVDEPLIAVDISGDDIKDVIQAAADRPASNDLIM